MHTLVQVSRHEYKASQYNSRNYSPYGNNEYEEMGDSPFDEQNNINNGSPKNSYKQYSPSPKNIHNNSTSSPSLPKISSNSFPKSCLITP